MTNHREGLPPGILMTDSFREAEEMCKWDTATGIQGVIFDWAGTLVDFGAMAAVRAYMAVFDAYGVALTEEEARDRQGLSPYGNVRRLLSTERIRREWEQIHGKSWGPEDVERLCLSLEGQLEASLKETARLKPGVLYMARKLHEAGIRIGSTSEYGNAKLRLILPVAEAQGFEPDCWVTADATRGKGRPYPYMIFQNMQQLELSDVHRVIKVGDTAEDIREGRAAGVWTVGVLDGSALMGLSEERYNALSRSELSQYRSRALEAYAAAGADFTVRNVTELVDVIRRLNGA